MAWRKRSDKRDVSVWCLSGGVKTYAAPEIFLWKHGTRTLNFSVLAVGTTIFSFLLTYGYEMVRMLSARLSSREERARGVELPALRLAYQRRFDFSSLVWCLVVYIDTPME